MGFVYDAIQLYDLGFGPRMVSVTPPDCDISPSSTLHPKAMGKAPGRLTQSGWTGVDVNSQKFRCHDYGVAKAVARRLGRERRVRRRRRLRRFRQRPGRDFLRSSYARCLNEPAPALCARSQARARRFFVRVLDFVGDGAPVANREMVFRNGVKSAKFSILAHGNRP